MKPGWKILLFLTLLVFAAGCGKFNFGGGNQPPKDPKGKPQSVGRYYDFDDIQVPRGMDLDKEKSILFNVGSLRAGVLVLSDRVEVESLINFFIDSMTRDNWRLMSSFKYPKVALFFLAFLPQFVRAGEQASGWPVLSLGLVFTACALAYKLVLGFFAGSLGEFIAGRPNLLSRARQASGAVMVGLGLKLALGGRD